MVRVRYWLYQSYLLVVQPTYPLMCCCPLLRYAGYVPVICPHSCDWYDSYEDTDILDRLLATVGRVMTFTWGNLQGCVQRHLYPVLGFEWTVARNMYTVIFLNKQMLVTTQSYVL